VMPELLNKKEHIAVVKTVDRVIDAATNTFRVRLELPNPGGVLPAGLRCKVDLGLKLPGAAPASPAAGAALPQGATPVLARN
jgi:membrane fusion protein, heavy metal efflux system